MALPALALEKQEIPIEPTGKLISSEWRLFNRTVDSFFSNQRSLEKENRSSIFLSAAFYKIEGSKAQTDLDFQMRIDLPQTTKKLRLVLEREQNEIQKALTNQNAYNKSGRVSSRYSSVSDNKYIAGADLILPKLKSITGLMKVGFRIDLPINPFLKLNLQKDFKTDLVNIDLMQTFILYRQAGFQEISQLSFSRKLNETFQADQSNSLIWTDQKDIFELRHSLSLYQRLGQENGLSYSIGANAKLSPSWYYESYDAAVSYRQLIYGHWLYGTFTLGCEFPKSENFNDEKFVQLRLEAFFR